MLPNAVIASIFRLAKVVRWMQEVEHIISHSQPVKEMLALHTLFSEWQRCFNSFET
jgi:hypothetical protein